MVNNSNTIWVTREFIMVAIVKINSHCVIETYVFLNLNFLSFKDAFLKE